jgi:hypothetical protein
MKYVYILQSLAAEEHFYTGITDDLDARLFWATRRFVPASISRMIRKLKSGQFRLYSRKKDASSGKRRNLGTFSSLEQAKKHEREVQYFKRH